MPDKERTIRESIHGTFFYHLAEDDKALCGKEMTMVTSIPVSFWGKQSHLHERYCEKCNKMK